jgi:chromosome partitioning protein
MSASVAFLNLIPLALKINFLVSFRYLTDTHLTPKRFSMIVTIGGIKGGSGTTTVATNLAIIRARAGRDVLLIDADDQETATDFTALRNERQPSGAGYTNIKLTGGAVRTETLRLKPKYEDIIIDTGGRDTTSQRAALTVSDVLLVPFVPRSFDVWTIEKVAELVEEMRTANPAMRAYTFINRADSRGNDNEDASEVLKDTPALEMLDAFIGQRKAFGNAAAEGLAVTELRQQDSKAVDEMIRLYRLVFDTN